jgi:hypothetical protein
MCNYLGMNKVEEDVLGIAKQSLGKPGQLSGMFVAAAPTLVFVVVNALSSLTPALLAAGATAIAAFVYRLIRREPLRQAVIGLAIVAVCAAVAALTGEARGFFLLPALIPFAVIVVCVGSVLARRPLTGVILNRVSGGPARWYDVPRLRRVHSVATLVCAGVNVVNATLQAVFYLADDTFVLAATHIATGPVFATIVAVTIVYARRAMPSR